MPPLGPEAAVCPSGKALRAEGRWGYVGRGGKNHFCPLLICFPHQATSALRAGTNFRILKNLVFIH